MRTPEQLVEIVEALDHAARPYELLAGENIYILTVLLLGAIQDAPRDVREHVRARVLDVLKMEPHSGDTLQTICLRTE